MPKQYNGPIHQAIVWNNHNAPPPPPQPKPPPAMNKWYTVIFRQQMHFLMFLYVQQPDPLIFIRKNDPSAKSLEYMS